MSFKVIDVPLWQSGIDLSGRRKMDTIKRHKLCQKQLESKIAEEKTAEKVIHTMLVVTEKHMQDANWVYYPFKNSHVHMEQCPF